MPNKTDMQVLKALLGAPIGALSNSEKSAFQEMYDKVASGQIIGLSSAQKSWTLQVYEKLKLDKERMYVPQKVKIRDKSLIGALDNMPKPLKPPGR